MRPYSYTANQVTQHDGWGSTSGPRLNIRPSFPGMGIPMLKIRRSRDRLIFNTWIPKLIRHLYIETAPRLCHEGRMQVAIFRCNNNKIMIVMQWLWCMINHDLSNILYAATFCFLVSVYLRPSWSILIWYIRVLCPERLIITDSSEILLSWQV